MVETSNKFCKGIIASNDKGVVIDDGRVVEQSKIIIDSWDY